MMKLWQGILLGVFIGIFSTAVGFLLLAAPRGEALALEEAPTPAPFVVQVGGAVQHPGVYTLRPGSRLEDAIAAAGGLSGEAAVDALNLAAQLKDGQKVMIPLRDAEGNPRAAGINVESDDGKLDINTASAASLEELPGIGASKAEAIVAYREANGWFTSLEELMNVPGIGQGIFDQVKDLVTITP